MLILVCVQRIPNSKRSVTIHVYVILRIKRNQNIVKQLNTDVAGTTKQLKKTSMAQIAQVIIYTFLTLIEEQSRL